MAKRPTGDGALGHLDFHALALRLERVREAAPSRRDRPEAAERLAARARHQGKFALGSGIAEAAPGGKAGPTRQGARVVMPALRLVPGIAPLAVKAPAGGFHDVERLRHHPLERQRRRKLVLQSRPNLTEIRKGNFRTFAQGIGGHHNSAFVVQGVGALKINMLAQVRLVVVLINRLQRGAHMRFLQQISEARHVRLHLAQQLVRQAGVTHLVIRFEGVPCPHADAHSRGRFGSSGRPSTF